MTPAGEVELVTLAEIGRRVGLTTERVRQLARDDPNWPIPRTQWRRVGRYWLVPWEPIKTYFAARDSRSGPKGWSQARGSATASTPDGSQPDDAPQSSGHRHGGE
jgi:hypothetical protein